MTYKSSIDNLFFFPDPLEYVIGFFGVPSKNFLNTTTSQFSEEFSDNSEEIKDRIRKSNLVEGAKSVLENFKEPS